MVAETKITFGACLGSARLGSARLGPPRLGSARLGSGSPRLGSARPGSARLGSAGLGYLNFPENYGGEKFKNVVVLLVKTYVFAKTTEAEN